MKTITLLLQAFFFVQIYGQAPLATTAVYFFPGTGSDERLFSKIQLPDGFTAHYIHYTVPNRGATMGEYAAVLQPQIDTLAPYILVGVSVGGMICTELADQLKPEKVIVISSSKCRQELPGRYRFQRFVPINKVLGARFIKAMSFVAQPVVEPDRNLEKNLFKAMLTDKDPVFIKRTANMIVNWERKTYDPAIIHIHGTNDHTLPLKNIRPSIIVPNGSHMMTLTRGEEINDLLCEALLAEQQRP